MTETELLGVGLLTGFFFLAQGRASCIFAIFFFMERLRRFYLLMLR